MTAGPPAAFILDDVTVPALRRLGGVARKAKRFGGC